VTAVVAILKIFGENINNSRNANPKKLLNKPNKWLNLKEKGLKGLRESIDDASKIILVKQKTIRVLLNTGRVVTSFSSKKDPKSTYLP